MTFFLDDAAGGDAPASTGSTVSNVHFPTPLGSDEKKRKRKKASADADDTAAGAALSDGFGFGFASREF